MSGHASTSERISVIVWSFKAGEIIWNARNHAGRHVTGFNAQRAFGDHGQFSITLSFSSLEERAAFLAGIEVDDYIAVASTANYLISFGYIAALRHIDAASEGGATVYQTVVMCLDWGNRYSQTEIWFDTLSQAAPSLTAFSQILHAGQAFNGTPRQTIFTIAEQLPRLFSAGGRPQWVLPDTLCARFHVPLGSGLVDVVAPQCNMVTYPYRLSQMGAILAMMHEPTHWDLMQQWAEPDFTELYTDLVFSPHPDGLKASWGSEPQYYAQAAENPDFTYFLPALVLRDRPLLSDTLCSRWATTPGAPIGLRDYNQPWRQLPRFHVSRRGVASIEVSESSLERKNAFFLHLSLSFDQQDLLTLLQKPRLLQESVEKYGVRRHDSSTRYLPVMTSAPGSTDGGAISPFGIDVLKRRAVDFNCMNHQMLSGSVELNYFLPCRIGTVLVLQDTLDLILDPGEERATHAAVSQADGASSPVRNRGTYEFYIEGYAHQWSYHTGLRTSLTVTHGYPGDADNRAWALERARGLFNDEVVDPLV